MTHDPHSPCLHDLGGSSGTTQLIEYTILPVQQRAVLFRYLLRVGYPGLTCPLVGVGRCGGSQRFGELVRLPVVIPTGTPAQEWVGQVWPVLVDVASWPGLLIVLAVPLVSWLDKG